MFILDVSMSQEMQNTLPPNLTAVWLGVLVPMDTKTLGNSFCADTVHCSLYNRYSTKVSFSEVNIADRFCSDHNYDRVIPHLQMSFQPNSFE